MRNFGYLTVGEILKRLKDDGLSISRQTFYNLEAQGLFESKRAIGSWRVYSPIEVNAIIKVIKENYGFEDLTPEESLEQARQDLNIQ